MKADITLRKRNRDPGRAEPVHDIGGRIRVELAPPDALGFEPAGVDVLVARTGLKADAVASMLLILELEGRIAQQPGGLFCRRLPGKKE